MDILENKVSETRRFYIEHNGKVVARAYVRLTPKEVYIFRVKTNLKFRNRGYASLLMNVILKEYNGKRFKLSAHGHDPEHGLNTKQLISFYEKFGFKLKPNATRVMTKE